MFLPKRAFAVCLVVLGLLSAPTWAEQNPSSGDTVSPHAVFHPAGDAVRWSGGFWGERFELCLNVVVPHLWRVMQLPENAATFHDLKMAGGLAPKAAPGGRKWSDGDCHKCVEAMAYLFAVTHSEELDRWMEEAIQTIARAQEPDGYLSSWVQLTGTPRWADLHNHELYNMGHLMTAACVHYRVTGKTTYLEVARRVGDYLYNVFSPRPKELAHFGFNPSNIMGAVDLYRTTKDPKYLELAKIFVDMRGSAPGGSNQNQSAVPLRKEQEAVGHCVTATYLWCGAADVYAETGEAPLRQALERLWVDVTTRKMYVTGAIGALHEGLVFRETFRRWPVDSVHEAFGMPYQLPNRTAYNETCANIGNAMWNWRMLQITGDARYAEVMERALYNSVLSGIGLKGTSFFYTNPLRRCGPDVPLLNNDSSERWSDCTPTSPVRCFCCPPNVARTLASLHQWAYGVSRATVWVNLFGNNVLSTELENGGKIKLVQSTNYPWEGMVKIQVAESPHEEWTLMLRIPEWAEGARITLNGTSWNEPIPCGTYVPIRRRWSPGDRIDLVLPMEVSFVQAHPLVEETRGQVAVMRGPLVYCLESVDLPEEVKVEQVILATDAKWVAREDPQCLGGVVVIEGEAFATPQLSWEGRLYQRWAPAVKRFPVRLIPYFAWGNRGRSEMTVWLPAR